MGMQRRRDARRDKGRWFSHISGIIGKGYEAAQAGVDRESCPYADSPYTSGVQAQRIKAWRYGFDRAAAGKPLNDSNG
jgi:ribosome modulation factor